MCTHRYSRSRDREARSVYALNWLACSPLAVIPARRDQRRVGGGVAKPSKRAPLRRRHCTTSHQRRASACTALDGARNTVASDEPVVGGRGTERSSIETSSTCSPPRRSLAGSASRDSIVDRALRAACSCWDGCPCEGGSLEPSAVSASPPPTRSAFASAMTRCSNTENGKREWCCTVRLFQSGTTGRKGAIEPGRTV